jgi:hypothetical protein
MPGRPQRSKKRPEKLAQDDPPAKVSPKNPPTGSSSDQIPVELTGVTQQIPPTPVLQQGSAVCKSLVSDVVHDVTTNLREELTSLVAIARSIQPPPLSPQPPKFLPQPQQTLPLGIPNSQHRALHPVKWGRAYRRRHNTESGGNRVESQRNPDQSR